ncbi:MAG: type II toxin-antitoxin system antitoxin SocA domain-containing protein [bacterium]
MINIQKTNKDFIFNTKDFILYILNRIEPAKSDKIRLNKIAFFVEFAYIFFNNKNLSNTKYAAIDKGPVIDDYDMILQKMKKEKLIDINGYMLRPLANSNTEPPEEIVNFIESIIDKYSKLSRDELISLSHNTDSYKITTNNEKEMGKIINKNLANLESFFCDNSDEQIDENCIPVFNKNKLVEYEL